MANTIQHKRGTEAEWTAADPTLAAGQVGVETDTGKFKFGDGSTAWSALGYFEAAAAVAAWSYGGENYGYAMGGYDGSTYASYNSIQKYSFTSDGSGTVSPISLHTSVSAGAGSQSSESGYFSGSIGSTGGWDLSIVNIQKFPFAEDVNGTDVGDLATPRGASAGNSSQTNGYMSGGFRQNPGVGYNNQIEKFPFAADGNATSVGTLLTTLNWMSGQSSSEYGYVSAGTSPDAPNSNVIQKFAFAADGDAADVGDLTLGRPYVAGGSSSTHGYVAGGNPVTNVIDKFSFSADENATDVGDLAFADKELTGASSTTNGYATGGAYIPAGYGNTIHKYSFTSDGNGTDIGDLAQRLRYSVGTNN